MIVNKVCAGVWDLEGTEFGSGFNAQGLGPRVWSLRTRVSSVPGSPDCSVSIFTASSSCWPVATSLIRPSRSMVCVQSQCLKELKMCLLASILMPVRSSFFLQCRFSL